MVIINNILSNYSKNTEPWEITKPLGGLSKESYIAQQGDRKVFVKFDVSVPPLVRLAELQLAPPILESGVTDGRSYIIQKYVEAIHPDQAWFLNNIPALASLVRTYHSDQQLRDILIPQQALSYKEHIAKEVAY